ncbi:hypothetical protein [Jiangella anatolica]|uniref:Uncharacterized protein n=1 Tax=Jiangella anatolica TaxID=2670374 RepID=A0A2W2B6K4_9ACTN|nr:hypothetical protein [Jiangella anatolica]PZF83081.1 hypothetical protein C1I92_14290 [Jiangella anatolica]
MRPPPPDIAIELLRRYRSSHRSREAGELVEVVVGRPAVAQRFQQLQRRAEREVLVLVKPPFVAGCWRR